MTKMQNKISIFLIKEARNKCLAKIALYRIKGKKCKSHQYPNSNNYNNTYRRDNLLGFIVGLCVCYNFNGLRIIGFVIHYIFPLGYP